MTQGCKYYFFMMNFGNLVEKSKLGAEAGRYLLFHIVQGVNNSLFILENFCYPRVYM